MTTRKPVYHWIASTRALWIFDNDSKGIWRRATPTEQAVYVATRSQ